MFRGANDIASLPNTIFHGIPSISSTVHSISLHDAIENREEWILSTPKIPIPSLIAASGESKETRWDRVRGRCQACRGWAAMSSRRPPLKWLLIAVGSTLRLDGLCQGEPSVRAEGDFVGYPERLEVHQLWKSRVGLGMPAVDFQCFSVRGRVLCLQDANAGVLRVPFPY
jgi:hypothetical protein